MYATSSSAARKSSRPPTTQPRSSPYDPYLLNSAFYASPGSSSSVASASHNPPASHSAPRRRDSDVEPFIPYIPSVRDYAQESTPIAASARHEQWIPSSSSSSRRPPHVPRPSYDSDTPSVSRYRTDTSVERPALRTREASHTSSHSSRRKERERPALSRERRQDLSSSEVHERNDEVALVTIPKVAPRPEPRPTHHHSSSASAALVAGRSTGSNGSDIVLRRQESDDDRYGRKRSHTTGAIELRKETSSQSSVELFSDESRRTVDTRPTSGRPSPADRRKNSVDGLQFGSEVPLQPVVEKEDESMNYERRERTFPTTPPPAPLIMPMTLPDRNSGSDIGMEVPPADKPAIPPLLKAPSAKSKSSRKRSISAAPQFLAITEGGQSADEEPVREELPPWPKYLRLPQSPLAPQERFSTPELQSSLLSKEDDVVLYNPQEPLPEVVLPAPRLQPTTTSRSRRLSASSARFSAKRKNSGDSTSSNIPAAPPSPVVSLTGRVRKTSSPKPPPAAALTVPVAEPEPEPIPEPTRAPTPVPEPEPVLQPIAPRVPSPVVRRSPPHPIMPPVPVEEEIPMTYFDLRSPSFEKLPMGTTTPAAHISQLPQLVESLFPSSPPEPSPPRNASPTPSVKRSKKARAVPRSVSPVPVAEPIPARAPTPEPPVVVFEPVQEVESPVEPSPAPARNPSPTPSAVHRPYLPDYSRHWNRKRSSSAASQILPALEQELVEPVASAPAVTERPPSPAKASPLKSAIRSKRSQSPIPEVEYLQSRPSREPVLPSFVKPQEEMKPVAEPIHVVEPAPVAEPMPVAEPIVEPAPVPVPVAAPEPIPEPVAQPVPSTKAQKAQAKAEKPSSKQKKLSAKEAKEEKERKRIAKKASVEPKQKESKESKEAVKAVEAPKPPPEAPKPALEPLQVSEPPKRTPVVSRTPIYETFKALSTLRSDPEPIPVPTVLPTVVPDPPSVPEPTLLPPAPPASRRTPSPLPVSVATPAPAAVSTPAPGPPPTLPPAVEALRDRVAPSPLLRHKDLLSVARYRQAEKALEPSFSPVPEPQEAPMPQVPEDVQAMNDDDDSSMIGQALDMFPLPLGQHAIEMAPMPLVKQGRSPITDPDAMMLPRQDSPPSFRDRHVRRPSLQVERPFEGRSVSPMYLERAALLEPQIVQEEQRPATRTPSPLPPIPQEALIQTPSEESITIPPPQQRTDRKQATSKPPTSTPMPMSLRRPSMEKVPIGGKTLSSSVPSQPPQPITSSRDRSASASATRPPLSGTTQPSKNDAPASSTPQVPTTHLPTFRHQNLLKEVDMSSPALSTRPLMPEEPSRSTRLRTRTQAREPSAPSTTSAPTAAASRPPPAPVPSSRHAPSASRSAAASSLAKPPATPVMNAKPPPLPSPPVEAPVPPPVAEKTSSRAAASEVSQAVPSRASASASSGIPSSSHRRHRTAAAPPPPVPKLPPAVEQPTPLPPPPPARDPSPSPVPQPRHRAESPSASSEMSDFPPNKPPPPPKKTGIFRGFFKKDESSSRSKPPTSGEHSILHRTTSKPMPPPPPAPSRSTPSPVPPVPPMPPMPPMPTHVKHAEPVSRPSAVRNGSSTAAVRKAVPKDKGLLSSVNVLWRGKERAPRTVSNASLEAVLGASNNYLTSPAVTPLEAPASPFPYRDPGIAVREWRETEAAALREKKRRHRPGVTFADLNSEPGSPTRPTRA